MGLRKILDNLLGISIKTADYASSFGLAILVLLIVVLSVYEAVIGNGWMVIVVLLLVAGLMLMLGDEE